MAQGCPYWRVKSLHSDHQCTYHRLACATRNKSLGTRLGTAENGVHTRDREREGRETARRVCGPTHSLAPQCSTDKLYIQYTLTLVATYQAKRTTLKHNSKDTKQQMRLTRLSPVRNQLIRRALDLGLFPPTDTGPSCLEVLGDGVRGSPPRGRSPSAGALGPTSSWLSTRRSCFECVLTACK